jgi:hypothetical protein
VVLEIKRKSWLLVLGVSISGSIKIQSFYINAYIFDFGVCWDFGGLLDFVGVWKNCWCCRYRHLMLNLVSLLPHCKKDSKVESTSTKGATLNELVELKNGSSSLFFEVNFKFSCFLP